MKRRVGGYPSTNIQLVDDRAMDTYRHLPIQIYFSLACADSARYDIDMRRLPPTDVSIATPHRSV